MPRSASGLDARRRPIAARRLGLRSRRYIATAVVDLDEPTNHLDIDSIATVEAGLSANDGALLVVSRDRAFLGAIGITREIELTAR